jgi:CRP-like cAMP-binding protein
LGHNHFRILLQNAFIGSQERISQQLSAAAHHRYELFQKKFPGLEQRVPQKYIASYLGITPAYLSRLRKKLI